MPVLGVTGGIATGKSSSVEALLRHLPAEVFDADRFVHQLLAGDETIISAVRQAFGNEVFDAEGRVSRTRLGEMVFAKEGFRKSLEAILHPVVRTRWMALAKKYRESNAWALVDIPLLFETGAESHFDRTLVVACSPATQKARLRDRRGLSVAMIEKIIGAQLPLSAKVNKADHIIWNDHTVSCLDRQAGLLARWLISYHG